LVEVEVVVVILRRSVVLPHVWGVAEVGCQKRFVPVPVPVPVPEAELQGKDVMS
jgi:hypothetical protein